MFNDTLYMAPSIPQQASGWGTATKYLFKELQNKIKVVDLRSNVRDVNKYGFVDGKVFHTITNDNFEVALNISGKYNAGYCFFENQLNAKSKLNANCLDHIFCGSTYNMEKLAELDVFHTSLLVQGVDMEMFKPMFNQKKDREFRDKFVIFSGGKFEYRKGQDLVLAAFKALQDKYKDLCLLTAWENVWDFSSATMNMSKYIDSDLQGDTWVEKMERLCAINRIYPGRVWHYPLLNHQSLYKIIRNSDIGIFPNRCEGGTNLALMEYMACGKPVIASFNSGHKDVLIGENSFRLIHMTPKKLEPWPGIFAEWYEPSLDELIFQIEMAYESRGSGKLEEFGKKAHDSAKKYTWERTAQNILNVMYKDERLQEEQSLTQRYRFGDLLTRMGLLGEGAEIGVQLGEFSRYVRGQWQGKRLYLVDHWTHYDAEEYVDRANVEQEQQNEYYAFVQRLFAEDDIVAVIRARSTEACEGFVDGQLDWVYIDADHSFNAVLADLRAWYPKVRKGGLIAGHDYVDGDFPTLGKFGVKSALRAFMEEIGYNGEVKLSMDEKNLLRTWYFVK